MIELKVALHPQLAPPVSELRLALEILERLLPVTSLLKSLEIDLTHPVFVWRWIDSPDLGARDGSEPEPMILFTRRDE